MGSDDSRDLWSPIFHEIEKKLSIGTGEGGLQVYVNGKATIELYGRRWGSQVCRKEKRYLGCLARTASGSTNPGRWVQAAVKAAAVRLKIFVNGETVPFTMRAQKFKG